MWLTRMYVERQRRGGGCGKTKRERKEEIERGKRKGGRKESWKREREGLFLATNLPTTLRPKYKLDETTS